ncbi:vacuole morphology and inheritance protein 14 [Babesia gibsoni]|uniref:Vacuole morphology and inheritance protein 14 n=1 Tax=Babesia gibsoni TaxID=33632 RepID=A0AAD8PEI4_BABGI|nr:vacuole morphology and inheritance protein 14 [Babesia gibsoni]
MFHDRNTRKHEFLPESSFSYLVEGSVEIRKKALNGITQGVRLYKQSIEGDGYAEKLRDAVQRFIELLKGQLLENPSPSYRIGGLIGLASAALALDDDLNEYVDEFIKTALPFFSDQDATVRYYTCESLYNIFKKAQQGVVRCFPDIFNGICKICCDVDEDVKQTSQFINRLIRDIVVEENISAELVINLIASRMNITNAHLRLLLVYIMDNDSELYARLALRLQSKDVPGINVMEYLPKVYIGCFNMLVDSNKDVRGAAELCLAEFLAAFKKTYASKVEIVNEELFKVILLNSQRNDPVVKKTNILWVKELALLQPQVVHFDGFPLFLKSIILSIADVNTNVSTIAQEANTQLYLTVKEGMSVAKVDKITQELTEVLVESDNQVVMLTILQWLTLLLTLKPRIMMAAVPQVTKAITLCFKKSNSDVGILYMPSSPLQLIMEETLKAITLLLELGDDNYDLLSKYLVDLFMEDKGFLEERGGSIIINVCKQTGFEKFYKITTECLSQYKDQEFLLRVVHTLNWTLLTSEGARDFRNFLLTEKGDELGSQLQRCWEYNLSASLSLALWREKYELSNEIVQKMSESVFGLDYWVATDSIVQLLDSHIFMKMRLHLLQPMRYPALLQALLGLSMILPQGETNRNLMRRLKISQLKQIAQQMENVKPS